IERACILTDTMNLEPRDLGLTPPDASTETLAGIDLSGTLSDVNNRALRFLERLKIRAALEQQDGNKVRAAEALGVSYKTLLTKVKKNELKNIGMNAPSKAARLLSFEAADSANPIAKNAAALIAGEEVTQVGASMPAAPA